MSAELIPTGHDGRPLPRGVEVVTPSPAFPYGLALRFRMSRGDRGVDQTAAAMVALIHDAAAMVALAFEATGVSLPGGGFVSFAESQRGRSFQVYEWARRRLRFRRDPRGVELTRTPRQVFSEVVRDGFSEVDCDDNTMACCALLMAARVPCGFVVMSPRKGPFVHVYPVALIEGATDSEARGYGMDAQENVPFGEHPRAARFKVYACGSI